jgi:hypothetical protein
MAETRIIPSLAPMSPGFNGSFRSWEQDFVSRLILSIPFGPLQQQIGGLEPTSNVGIWWKDGTKPYVWDETEKKYIPANVSDSVSESFWYGATTPTGTTPTLWLRTYATGLKAEWRFYDGTDWVRVSPLVTNGTTANRPSAPEDYEQYFDTDIDCLIHWERAAWRTVSGTPGDLKFVDMEQPDYATAVTVALARNPGWLEVGVAARGRVLGVAGAGTALTARDPEDSVGVETVTLTAGQMPRHSHNVTYQEMDEGGDPQHPAGSVSTDVNPATRATTEAGNDEAHENMQPTIFYVALKKS